MKTFVTATAILIALAAPAAAQSFKKPATADPATVATPAPPVAPVAVPAAPAVQVPQPASVPIPFGGSVPVAPAPAAAPVAPPTATPAPSPAPVAGPVSSPIPFGEPVRTPAAAPKPQAAKPAPAAVLVVAEGQIDRIETTSRILVGGRWVTLRNIVGSSSPNTLRAAGDYAWDLGNLRCIGAADAAECVGAGKNIAAEFVKNGWAQIAPGAPAAFITAARK